jgi:hypothetical protein
VGRPRGTLLVNVEGASCLYEGNVCSNEIWPQDKIYTLVSTLRG